MPAWSIPNQSRLLRWSRTHAHARVQAHPANTYLLASLGLWRAQQRWGCLRADDGAQQRRYQSALSSVATAAPMLHPRLFHCN
jgi:hypothetical protein